MKIKISLPVLNILVGLLSMLPIFSLAQSSKKILTYLDAASNPVPSEKNAALVEERWQENGKWKAKVFDMVTRIPRSEYGYADSTRQTLHGTYILYSNNRRKISEQHYNMGVADGPITQWLPDGTLQLKGNVKNGIFNGRTEQYDFNGKLKAVYDTDASGNGTGTEYMATTGYKAEGTIRNGRQYGVWVYKNNSDQKRIEVTYNDSGTIDSETCFDNEGKQITTGECHSDRRADFPGGRVGWQKHLDKNLKYPKEARKANIQGDVYVRFLVRVDGSIDNVKVVDSPDPDLAAAAEEVVAKSPKWIPAIECNQLIPATRYERITFILK